ncbi:GNAT family N-acetyltransferase [Robertkochia solimangrovi]|uniref:GNAT family N-acetyltransferase n=1 Tax=Robertkochia solimangrovi TaxID=2213046 RepID=UPI0013A573F0|nr:GNAT family N-acetyltransferase [Robertkochia solimangrovi]
MKIIKFYQADQRIEEFFAMLPADWQESIVPDWDLYKKDTSLFIGDENGRIVAGGLLFTKSAPEMESFANTASELFLHGAVYLGYIWVPETERGKGLGSAWLQHVQHIFPQKTFWLTIEDESLIAFYERNGYRLIKENRLTGEWLLIHSV